MVRIADPRLGLTFTQKTGPKLAPFRAPLRFAMLANARPLRSDFVRRLYTHHISFFPSFPFLFSPFLQQGIKCLPWISTSAQSLPLNPSIRSKGSLDFKPGPSPLWTSQEETSTVEIPSSMPGTKVRRPRHTPHTPQHLPPTINPPFKSLMPPTSPMLCLPFVSWLHPPCMGKGQP